MSQFANEWHSTVSANFMKGLYEFIKDIRGAQSKEAEEKRVQVELAKIRKSFRNEKMKEYDRRKYVSKLVYIHMLGYETDFGYMEAIKLMSIKTNKYQEKHMGYVALSLLLHETHEMIPLMVQQMQKDLSSEQDPVICLALNAIANLGGQEMAEALSPAVQKIVSLKSTSILVKKKACLALLRLFRKFPDLLAPDVWKTKMTSIMNESNIGLLTAASSLLIALATKDPEPYESLSGRAIAILSKLILQNEAPHEYIYCGVSAPFLVVKLMKFLELYGTPSNPKEKQMLHEVLTHVLDRADTSKTPTVNHKNAAHCVLFEAINLIIALDDSGELIKKAISLLGKFLSFRELNVRYLALEALTTLATTSPENISLLQKHQENVLQSLHDPDISIRKRALNLLYAMCDKESAEVIVSALIKYLTVADYKIREELVLKIAILAEKFATDYSWYVDAILKLIALAGDFVTPDIWFRVIHLVSNHEDIQAYACKVVLKALQRPNCHETAIKVGGYILGEWGHLIADFPSSGPLDQFKACHDKFFSTSLSTRALLLSTYAKFVNLYPELTDTVRKVFRQHMNNIDSEIQQRALEYYALTDPQREVLLQVVWDVIPAFPSHSIDRMEQILQQGSSAAIQRRGSISKVPQGVSTPKARTELPKTPQKEAPLTKNTQAFDPIEELLGMVTSSSTQNSVSNLSDSLSNLLGLGNSASPYSPTAAPQNTSNYGNAALSTGPTSSSVSSGGGSSVITSGPDLPTSALVDNNRLKKLALAPEGILTQDQILQVGFKSTFYGSTGRIMLYYGNTTSSPITNFSVKVSAQDHLTVVAQNSDSTISPQTQMQQLITLTCVKGFDKLDKLPTVTLNFVHNGQNQQISFILPVVLSRFLEPLKLSAPDFFKKWRDLSEHQEVLKSGQKVDPGSLSRLFSELHFALIQGVDNNPNNLVSVAVFHSSSSSAQNLILLRVETNPSSPNMIRVTCRAQEKEVAVAVVNLIKLQTA